MERVAEDAVGVFAMLGVAEVAGTGSISFTCGCCSLYCCTKKCVGIMITLMPLKMRASTSEDSRCATTTPARALSTLGTAIEAAINKSTLSSIRNFVAPTVLATLREARLAPLAEIWLRESSPVREGLII